mgnify:CR=1 FL=1
MKATIKYDLSKIMKTAWTIFKGNTPYSYSFAAALSRAWYVAKAEKAYEAEQERIARAIEERKAREARITDADREAAKAAMKAAMVAGCLKYYTEATNRYYGD